MFSLSWGLGIGDCSSLTSIDLSNFNTSNVYDMSSMFMVCYSLTSLDLSNFDTSNVEDMEEMFYRCSSLIFLNINSFDTSSVTSMGLMFYKCSSLTSLDLSNFDTSNVEDMGGMFSNCSSLSDLDLSNFNTNQVHNFDNMFLGCSLLQFIKLYSVTLIDGIKDQIMNLISQNITFCSEMENWNSSIIQKKGVICGDIENFIPFKCFMNQDFNEINKHTCKLCGNNFFQLYNNEDNKNINCYESLMGYYLDENDLLFKRCYDSCKTCEITGNVIEHNCIECNDNYTYEFNLSNYKNCFTNNPYDVTTDIISNSYLNYSLKLITNIISNAYSNYLH